MKRLLQLLTLGAVALLFTAASPGIAAADQGRGGGRGGAHQGFRPDNPYFKPYEGYKNYGQYRRDRNRHFDGDRRRHQYRDQRWWRRYGDRRPYHRPDYYGRRYWHRHHDYRHEYGVWPFIGLYFYPSVGTSRPIEAVPPAYPAQAPAYPVQPAVVEQPVADAGAPSSCLMTREYQTEIMVGGELVPAYGEACLQPDGSWYRGPAVPESY